MNHTFDNIDTLDTFREMFTNHDKYLAERVEVESEDGEDFHP
jgi:hypothetical protein